MKQRVYSLLFDKETAQGRAFDFFIISLILLSLTAMVVVSCKTVRLGWHKQFQIFEIFTIIVFSLEYLLRLWTCTLRAKEDKRATFKQRFILRFEFMMQPISIIDLLAVLPFYLGSMNFMVIRLVRAGRLFRLFKLTRYSRAIESFGDVFSSKKGFFAVFIFFICSGLFIFSTLLYIFEFEVNPVYSSIPATFWWCLLIIGQTAPKFAMPLTQAGLFMAALLVVVFRVGLICTFGGVFAAAFIEKFVHGTKQSCCNADCGFDEIDIDADYCPVCGELINQIHDCCSKNPRWFTYCKYCGKKLHH